MTMFPSGLGQLVGSLASAFILGVVFMMTFISARGPSQVMGLLLVVWLTKKEVVPTVVVAGFGAVVDDVPPVAASYQRSVCPDPAVAVSSDEGEA